MDLDVPQKRRCGERRKRLSDAGLQLRDEVHVHEIYRDEVHVHEIYPAYNTAIEKIANQIKEKMEDAIDVAVKKANVLAARTAVLDAERRVARVMGACESMVLHRTNGKRLPLHRGPGDAITKLANEWEAYLAPYAR